LNPYYLGYKIFEDIERRWTPLGGRAGEAGPAGDQGREKIFEVREIDSDVSFLRNYLTEELCEELDLFVYELVEEEEWTISEKRWNESRSTGGEHDELRLSLHRVEDGDYNGNSELYLKHCYEGTELTCAMRVKRWNTSTPSGPHGAPGNCRRREVTVLRYDAKSTRKIEPQ